MHANTPDRPKLNIKVLNSNKDLTGLRVFKRNVDVVAAPFL